MSQSTKSTKSRSALAQAMRDAYFAPVATTMSYDQFVELFHAQYCASQKAQELSGTVIHYTDSHIAQFVAEHGVEVTLVEQYFAQLSKRFFKVHHNGRQMFEWFY